MPQKMLLSRYGRWKEGRNAMYRKNAWEQYDEKELARLNAFAEKYKAYLDAGKTERECVTEAVRLAKGAGFADLDEVIRSGGKLHAGDRVYRNWMGKDIMLFVVGEKPLQEGMNILGAHIDSPRIDVKQNPLYEEEGIAYLDTHYYGGIKKYQWTAIPLALHGTIIRKDGSSLSVAIGEEEGDPVFCVTDLLPHLAADQMKKSLAEGIEGEKLNILIGSAALRDDTGAEKVKIAIARLLFEKYGIREEDFLSAELCAVPAFKARDLGLDRSMIGAYGHDDRVCAYPILMAEIDEKSPEYTSVTILADKEETGSNGPTGMNSYFLKDFMEDLADMAGCKVRHVAANSHCFSADVNAAFDPAYGEVHERRNASYINYGVVVTKYTGARGKAGTNDATAEMMGFARRILDEENVGWQTGELGKVDQGGGGTVAMYVSQHNIDTVDLGVPVLSMHAPFEVVAKADVYMTYRAMRAFYK